jgi:hypothetical protein
MRYVRHGLSTVMPALVAGIHVFECRVEEDVDGRNIGVRKHAVLRTAKPGHDDWRDRTPYFA